MRAMQFNRRALVLEGWPICVTSYKVGERCLAKVDNVEPGAVIARGDGPTVEQAEAAALEKAAARLRTTRRHPVATVR